MVDVDEFLLEDGIFLIYFPPRFKVQKKYASLILHMFIRIARVVLLRVEDFC